MSKPAVKTELDDAHIFQAPKQTPKQSKKRSRTAKLSDFKGGFLCIIHADIIPFFKVQLILEKGQESLPGLDHWKELYGPEVNLYFYRVYQRVAE